MNSSNYKVKSEPEECDNEDEGKRVRKNALGLYYD